MSRHEAPKTERAAHLRLEESVNKTAMLLDLMGEVLASRTENSEVKHAYPLAFGLLTMVQELKNNLLNDYEAAHEEWKCLHQSSNN